MKVLSRTSSALYPLAKQRPSKDHKYIQNIEGKNSQHNNDNNKLHKNAIAKIQRFRLSSKRSIRLTKD